MRISRPDAGEELVCLAAGDTINHGALLVGLAPRLLASHLAPRLTSTPALAAPVLPKFFLDLVGAVVVGTTTGFCWDACVVVEDEALVALAARRAWLAAGRGGFGVGAGGRTRRPAGLKVAVLGASLSCGDDN